MATFIALLNFTEQGIANIKDTAKRADAVDKALQKGGAKMKDIYWTLGGYDGVLIFDAPDDESAAALMMGIGRLGNVSSETLRAFSRDEIPAILSKVK